MNYTLENLIRDHSTHSIYSFQILRYSSLDNLYTLGMNVEHNPKSSDIKYFTGKTVSDAIESFYTHLEENLEAMRDIQEEEIEEEIENTF